MPSDQSNKKKHSKDLIGKQVVSNEGTVFGRVGDIVFETSSGELIHIVIEDPKKYIEKLDLERNKDNQHLIPFSAVAAMGDFLVISESDII